MSLSNLEITELAFAASEVPLARPTVRVAETKRTNPLLFYLCHSYVFKLRTIGSPMFLFTEEAAYLFSCNPPIACPLTAGHMLVAGFGPLFSSGSGPDDVVSVEGINFSEENIPEGVGIATLLQDTQHLPALCIPELVAQLV